MPTYRYARGSTSVSDINNELDRLWNELGTDPGLKRDLAKAHIDPTTIPSGPRSELIDIKIDRQGIDLSGATVLVALAARRVLVDLWQKVLLPRLIRSYGADALRKQAPKRSPQKSKAKAVKTRGRRAKSRPSRR